MANHWQAWFRGLLLLSCILLGLGPGLTRAEPAPAPAVAEEPAVSLYFFWSARCPHCLEARPFIESLPARHPWIQLHSLEISRSRENLAAYVDMAARLGEEARSVPALLFCNEMLVGWQSDAISGPMLLDRLAQCRDRLARGETLNARAPAPPAVSLPGGMDISGWSLPLLTVAIAAMDAFNPCAFFVLLFLLSLLVHQQDRRRMLLIGGVFVLVSGLMYFAFMAAWLGLFRVMGSLPWVTAGAGALALAMGLINIKDWFAFKQGISLSIPESRKADIFRRGREVLAAGSLPAMLLAAVLLATAANFYELLCTAGFPMVYTRILTLRETGTVQHLMYLALYNTVYVLPLLAIVLAFVRTMGARKLTEREGRLLKLLSGLMMTGLGVLLVLAPERLGHVGVALGLMAAAVLVTWLASRWERGRTPQGGGE
jgi:hypothetical protein